MNRLLVLFVIMWGVGSACNAMVGDFSKVSEDVVIADSGTDTGTDTSTSTSTSTGSADTDTGTGTDIDTGTDTDSDTGTSTELGTGTGTGIETDSETETETGTESEVDTGTGTDSADDTETGIGTSTGIDTDTDTDTDTGFDTDSGSDTNPCGVDQQYYVDWEAYGVEVGTSWQDAFTTIQTAIDYAAFCGGGTVYVAQGGYTENVVMAAGVAVFGGYNAADGHRDIHTHVTTIDADGAGHVVYIGEGEGMVLDGFTITGGKADGTIGDSKGGGIHAYGDRNSPEIRNCTIIGNAAEQGGGIYLGNTNLSIVNCRILNNIASGLGGGIYYYSEFSQVSVKNTVIVGNQAGTHGGGVFGGDYSNLTNVTIVNNSATTAGGIYISPQYPPTLTNAIIWGNVGGQLGDGIPFMTYSCVQDWSGGGEGNTSDDPFLEEDGYHIRKGSSCIDVGNSTDPLLEDGDVDIDGDDRFIDDAVDIGADEFNDALILLLPMEDGSSETSDASGNDYHATVMGPLFADGMGIGGSNAFTFSFTDGDQLVIEGQDTQMVSNELTIEAWVFPTSWENAAANYNRIVSRYPIYHLRCVSDGYPSMHLATVDNENVGLLSPGAISLNEWHHIAGTFDGKQAILYVDGEAVAIKELLSDDIISPSSGNFSVGEVGALAEGFNGQIDNVAVYRRVKRPYEIRETWLRYAP